MCLAVVFIRQLIFISIGIVEGVCSIIHAAPRTELKELHILRDILMHKYGREFSLAVMENRDGCVSNRIMGKLTVATPAPDLVDAYLREIAKAYGVPWTTPDEPRAVSPEEEGEPKVTTDKDTTPPSKSSETKAENDQSNSQQAASVTPEPSKVGDTKKSQSPPAEDEFELLSKRFAELKKR